MSIYSRVQGIPWKAVLLVTSTPNLTPVYSNPEIEFKGPIVGNLYDIQNFLDSIGSFGRVIESSQSIGHMVSKKSICNGFSYQFKNAKIIYLFFSGHGCQKEGDWLVETQQNGKPILSSFSFEQIVNLWNLSKIKSIQSHLYILMDSCFSGKWCEKLSKLKIKDITIISSCQPHMESASFKGGLLLKYLFQNQESNLSAHWNKLSEFKQNPLFCSSSGVVSKFNQSTLKQVKSLLKKSISQKHLHKRDYLKRNLLELQTQCSALNENPYDEQDSNYNSLRSSRVSINRQNPAGLTLKTLCLKCKSQFTTTLTRKNQKINIMKEQCQIECKQCKHRKCRIQRISLYKACGILQHSVLRNNNPQCCQTAIKAVSQEYVVTDNHEDIEQWTFCQFLIQEMYR